MNRNLTILYILFYSAMCNGQEIFHNSNDEGKSEKNVAYLKKQAHEVMILCYSGKIDKPIPNVVLYSDPKIVIDVTKKVHGTSLNEIDDFNYIFKLNLRLFDSVQQYIDNYHDKETAYTRDPKHHVLVYYLIMYENGILKHKYYIKHKTNCFNFFQKLKSILGKEKSTNNLIRRFSLLQGCINNDQVDLE